MIVETTCNRLFRVRTDLPSDLYHVFFGIEVKRTRAGFVPKAKAKPDTMVRKAGCRIVAEG